MTFTVTKGWVDANPKLIPTTHIDRGSHPLKNSAGQPLTTPLAIELHTNGAGNASVKDFEANMLRQIAAGNPDATIPHFQVAKDGTFGQFVDLEHAGVTCLKANPWTVGIESAGVVEAWTDEALETLAQLLAAIHLAYPAVPLHRAPSWIQAGIAGHCESETLDDGRGFGHPNTSKWEGKICPGPARITQIDGIIARALIIANPPPTPPKKKASKMDKIIYTAHQGKGIWLYSVAGGLRYAGDPSFVETLKEADGSNVITWTDTQMYAAFTAYNDTVGRQFYDSLPG